MIIRARTALGQNAKSSDRAERVRLAARQRTLERTSFSVAWGQFRSYAAAANGKHSITSSNKQTHSIHRARLQCETLDACFFVRFFVRSESRFFIPTRSSAKPSRAGAVKVGRRTNLSTCFALARPYLDSFEHDGPLGAVGMTIRGELAFGRGSIAPQPCIR